VARASEVTTAIEVIWRHAPPPPPLRRSDEAQPPSIAPPHARPARPKTVLLTRTQPGADLEPPAPAVVPPARARAARTLPFAQLSALAAARTLIDAPTAVVDMSSPQAASETLARPRSAPSWQGVEDTFAHAAAKPDLELKRKSDGSYFYRGEGIRAFIQPNGDVKFEDRAVSDPEIRAAAPREPHVAAAAPAKPGKPTIFAVASLKVAVDLTGPHTAERRWFLDHTELFREKLRHKEGQRQLSKMTRVLLQIWSAKATFAERRRRTLELLSSLSDDELGGQARALILQLVQERCPQGSACAFDDQELRVINSSTP
jgi:hypothetical protein